ncbi:hypothetical protein L0222_31000 [bacterium]|nr:hypothetical protein [bacterium]
MNPFRKSFYSGIFLIASSTLLLEVTLAKVFAVIHFHYFAFFIISTALFGYGFSGVVLSIWKRFEEMDKNRLLSVSSLLFASTTVLAYRLILFIPLRITELLSSPLQMIFLLLVFLLLSLPFFFSGIVIGLLLTCYSEYIPRLYFADLSGAALGCFAIVAVIPFFGGSGTVLFAAILAALAGLAFAEKTPWRLLPVCLIVVLAALIPGSEEYFPTASKSEKRYFRESIENKNRLLYTGWSPAARIDVVTLNKKLKVIWIDGGTCQSIIRGMRHEKLGTPGKFVRTAVEIPLAFVVNPEVLIIGPGGGSEVMSALHYRPKHVWAVELDPLITKIMLGQFSSFGGDVYKRPQVTMINEEGRSFIRRSNRKFDIIQQKNNTHSMAVASGALNLTETYLLTKEAFHEYLDHLNPNGFLSTERHGSIRLLNLAAETLKERGVHDYWKQLVLIRKNSLNQIFLMKNGEFTEAELNHIEQYAHHKDLAVLYSPRMRDKVDTVYARLMNEGKKCELLKGSPFNLEAPTDDKPFIEHFFKLESLWSDELKRKLTEPFWQQASLEKFSTGMGAYPDLALYVILVEAIILSTAFIIFPLLKMRRVGVATIGAGKLLTYYFGLGVGFIFIEIALIQKYVLFIGYPVYAVAAILFSLLVAAGLGSFFSNRFASDPFRLLRWVIVFIGLLTLFQILVIPILFQKFLSISFPGRIALSFLFIFPYGFFMGMPFPLALTWTSKHFPNFVPWAWGVNGYATVTGSVLSVILALNFGFGNVLLIAVCIYVVSYIALVRAARAKAEQL